MNPIEEVVNRLMDEGRYPVLRTKNTEERQPLPENVRALVLRRDHYKCVICGSRGLLEADHIIPWSAGGSDDPDNLRTLCQRCNQERSNFKIPIDGQRRIPIGIECVYCNREILGDERLETVWCLCGRTAPGLPRSTRNGQVHHADDDLICDFCRHKKKAHADTCCFFGPSCPCEGFELNRDGLDA
jgi:hypothetical protein